MSDKSLIEQWREYGAIHTASWCCHPTCAYDLAAALAEIRQEIERKGYAPHVLTTDKVVEIDAILALLDQKLGK